MQKYIVYCLLLAISFSIPVPAFAIDGDFGNPYASGPQDSPRPLVQGEQPTYGGRNAGIPPVSMFGGVLVILGAGAVTYWHVRSKRMARTA